VKVFGLSGIRAVITVSGKDQVGIIAWIATLLARHNANILDTSQTILEELFSMTMIVDLAALNIEFSDLRDILANQGEIRGLKVAMQYEDAVFR